MQRYQKKKQDLQPGSLVQKTYFSSTNKKKRNE